MIGPTSLGGHDPNPLTTVWLLRLVVASSTVVAVQVALVDPIDAPLIRHLDLPLAIASVLVLSRPSQSAVIGLVFGLIVDASGQRLFGLHTVAYAALGPVAHHLPVPAWRRRSALVAWRAAAQGVAVAAVVAAGLAVASGGPGAASITVVVQIGLLNGLVAIPLSRWFGADAALGVVRSGDGLAGWGAGGGRRAGMGRARRR